MNERILPDNTEVYPGVKYVLDGVPTVNQFSGTVAGLKADKGISEVRYFDRAGRADAAGLAQTESGNVKFSNRTGWRSKLKY